MGSAGSPRNLPQPRSAYETCNTSRHRKRLNVFKSTPVASLRNLQDRHFLLRYRCTGLCAELVGWSLDDWTGKFTPSRAQPLTLGSRDTQLSCCAALADVVA